MRYLNSMGSYIENHSTSFYLLLAILLVGTILRVYGLGDQTYWHDEIITLKVAQGSLESIVSGGRPPLYLVFAHFWFEIFGVSEVATRLLSIIFGVSSIVLIFIVGKMLFNRNVGLISAFFMAISQYQIYYSQEIRYYSLYEFLTLASFYFYIRLLKSKSYINTVLYVVSTVLAFYTHDMAVLIILVQNLYLLIKYKKHRSIFVRWVITQLIVLISIAPRLIASFSTKAIGEFGPNWITSPDMLEPLYTIYRFIGISDYRFIGISEDFKYFLFGCIAIIILFVGTIVYFFVIGKVKWVKSLNQFIATLKHSWNINTETMLVILWLFAPIGLLLIMSKIIKPMYLDRYLICSAPACYILVALLLTKLNKIIPIVIILITIAIMISPGLYDYYTKPVREDWREVGSYIEEHNKRSYSVVLISWLSLPSFKWYNRGNNKYCSLPKRDQLNKIDVTMLFNLCELDDIDHFWVILSKKQINKSFESSYYRHKDSLYRIVKEREFVYNRKSPLTLYSFEKVNE